MNRITVRGTDGTERTYPLHGGTLAIGRDPGCAICLQDAQVSWQHAVLSHDGGTCVIEDLGSSNGTFVGAERIRRQVLNAGEIVRIGPYELALQLQATPSPTSASEHTMFDMVAFRAATPVARPNEQTAKQQALGADRSLAHWLRSMPLSESYRTASLRQEIVAGLTVAALVVPQGMAYALLAGLPPAMGLYASVLPMIVYALAGSGRQTSVGPVTVDSLMLVLGLSTLATAGTSSFIALAILLTALIGAIQLAMGALRLGFLVNFLSYPVLAGFTSAAAVITVLGQLKHVLGISEPQQAQLYRTVTDVVVHAGQSNPITLVIALGCMFVLWAVKRWAPTAPGALALVVVCTGLAYALGLDARGVNVLGPVAGGWPQLSLPSLHWAEIRQVMPLALTMALVGFAQTISVGKSLGNKFGYDIDANRELTALGLSNLTSSVSHGYAVSGSLARSALNAAAGARTQVAAIVSALCVGVTTLFFTPLFHYLPQATLAAILIVSSLRLIDTREIRYLFKVKITEGVLLVFTFVATLALGIMPGLLLGIVASILLFITLNTRPNTAILGRLPNTNIFRNVQHFPEAETIASLVILRIDASLYFANTVFLKEKVHEICRQHAANLKALILDASAVNDLDSSADTALHQLSAEFKKKGIEFYIAGVKAPVRDVMKRSGLYAVLGSDHFFFTIDAAVKRFQDKTRHRQ
ncbi:MAG TPA: sulfate permease [Steroidobacteraceae bacterium]|nr:sulfate permease [Steroidobacteraceae bacterium]